MNEQMKPLVVLQARSPMNVDQMGRVKNLVDSLNTKGIANFVVVDESLEASACPDMSGLSAAIRDQASSIDSLARSVAELVALIAEEQTGEDAPPVTYMDGTPISN